MARIELTIIISTQQSTSHERTVLIPDSGQDLCSEVTNPVQNCLFVRTNRKPHPQFMSNMVEIVYNVIANHNFYTDIIIPLAIMLDFSYYVGFQQAL